MTNIFLYIVQHRKVSSRIKYKFDQFTVQKVNKKRFPRNDKRKQHKRFNWNENITSDISLDNSLSNDLLLYAITKQAILATNRKMIRKNTETKIHLTKCIIRRFGHRILTMNISYFVWFFFSIYTSTHTLYVHVYDIRYSCTWNIFRHMIFRVYQNLFDPLHLNGFVDIQIKSSNLFEIKNEKSTRVSI